MLLRILKQWTLPISMVFGAGVFFLFHEMPVLAPVKPAVWDIIAFLTPTLIFTQLFLTFCKMDPRQLIPNGWHGWLLLFQLAASALTAAVLLFVPMDIVYREIFEGALVCLICPTATAAAVITDKLGGSAASLTVYTLLANLLAAVFVPLVFPLVEPHEGLTFAAAFLKILSKVFPLLLCPFLLAVLLRYGWPQAHRFFLRYTHLAFYLWAVALAIVSGQTVRSLWYSSAPAAVLWMIAGGALACCAVQFWLGKRIGSRYGDRISAGQALGQKNTVLAIWMAYTYLNPISSLAPGTYVLWQNIFNSWQLWRKGQRR